MEQRETRGPVLLRQAEAADVLDVSERFLEERRWKGGGSPYVRLSSRAVRYRLSDLEAWIADRVRTSTSDPGPSGE